MNLTEIGNHFKRIYERKNLVHYPSLNHHIMFLLSQSHRLTKAFRKHAEDKDILGENLARMVARILAIVNHGWDLPFTESMCKKFPEGECSSCHAFECICEDEERAEYVFHKPSNEQPFWNLHDHQKNLDRVFGKTNSDKGGVLYCLHRLDDEIKELNEIAIGHDHLDSSVSDIEDAYTSELADILAWTIAVAVQLNIDLEHYVREVYENGCPECKHVPCDCKRFRVVNSAIVMANTQLA
ncbi:MAG: hypothetical protein V4576_01330 [Patescibacteria group bacterium]